MTQPTPTQLLMRRPHLRDLPAMPPLPDGYEIRTADGVADEDDVARVMTAAFAEEWTVERVQKSLTAAPDVLAVYVMTWEDRPVATASSRVDALQFPGSGYVHWVGALPEHAGRGLGTALMVRLLHDFEERGYADAVLETDDFRIPAIRSYLRCGFIPVYEVKGEDQRQRWSAIFESVFAPRG